jgi:phytol kinase
MQIHILTGPLYLLCWYLFDNSESAKYWACMVPLAMTLKVGAVGAGLLKDPSFVNSMSRSGRASELLLGPFTYGAIFVASTLIYWRHSPGGILSMLLLCVGDGYVS